MKMTRTFLSALGCAALLAIAPVNAQSISSQDIFNGQFAGIGNQVAVGAAVAVSAAKAEAISSAVNVGNVFDANVNSKAISNNFAGSFQTVDNLQISVINSQTAIAGSLAVSVGNAMANASAINAGNVGGVVINSVAKK